MDRTLQSQLSMIPIPRLTSVLRVNVDLSPGETALPNAARLILNWWNKKAEPYGAKIDSDRQDFSFAQNRFKIEFAQTSELFAMAMEEPDSNAELHRDWICDFGLRSTEASTQLEVRVSYRQPHNVAVRPEPRAPKMLRDLLVQVGVVDVWPMEVAPRTIDAVDVPQLVDLLRAPGRRLPVIALSDEIGFGPVTDPNPIAKVLAGVAHTVHMTSGASWELSKLLGQDWSVYQGAVRCYNPQIQWAADEKFRHRLWFANYIRRTNAGTRDGFLNACAVHVFTQVTAQFETLPLLSPSAVRRHRSAHPVPAAAVLETPFVLVEPKEKPKQMSLEALTPAPTAFDPPPTSAEKDQLVLKRENEELKQAIEELRLRLNEQEERSKEYEHLTANLESQIEQERAGRAQDASVHQETRDSLWVYEQDLKELKERDSLLGGGALEKSEPLKPLWQDMSHLFQTLQQVATQFRRLEEDSSKLIEMAGQVDELNEKNAKTQAKLDSLNMRPNTEQDVEQYEYSIPRSAIVRVIPQITRKPTLEGVLRCIDLLFSDRCVVLPSAYASANQSSEFRQTPKAFDLLWKLVTDYWEAMVEGRGDVVARAAFGTEAYAAKESSKLSKEGISRRTFSFGNQNILMEKHLKIGVADNAADTLRVHFEWMANEGKIIIGHCGKHLNFR